jgi:protein TonB
MNTVIADLQPSLPWTTAAEDRRFRRILVLSLLVFTLLATGVTWLPVRRPEVAPNIAFPPRLARIIEHPVSADIPAAGDRTSAPEPRLAAPPQPPREPPPVNVARAPVARKVGPPSPREQAARSGVLAMSETLAELSRAMPRLGVASGSGEEARRGKASEDVIGDRSMLTAGITRGSGGLGGEVPSYGALLGTSEGLGGAIDGSGGSGRGGDGLAGAGGRGQPEAAMSGSGGRGTSPSGETRSREEIQEILERNKPAIYKLYNNALRRDPDLQGRVLMSITIEPGGRVTACSIVFSELKAPALESQLVEFIRRIDFGAKPGVRVVTTRVPIEFFPI